MTIILGLESSCDETAAALINNKGEILAHALYSQVDEHTPYAGVVPEIAARAHVERIDSIINSCFAEAKLTPADVDAIAATAGPGLLGGVMIGLTTAKAMAMTHRKPLVAVNHLEAHALTARLSDDVPFPFLLLLVSGGHCQILRVNGVGDYQRLGATIDDAVGEAFDKTAKLLRLGFPGGPIVERMARDGDPARFDLPRPMKGRAELDFSFSGLKTAVRQALAKCGDAPTEQDRADLCASFQQAVSDVLADRVGRALDRAADDAPDGQQPLSALVVAGGVAANQALRDRLTDVATSRNVPFVAPPIRLCTDNGVMVAWAGYERFRLGLTDPLDFAPRARWPLDPDAEPLPFAGRKA